MLDRFIHFLRESAQVAESEKLLVGVSGGIDSVVLLDLLTAACQPIAIAHCNFMLRGDASDLDAAFVAQLARSYGCEYFSASFDTIAEARNAGISIEMAARHLRYVWFEKIRSSQGFDKIAVAHHLDDQAETFFLNLARGTGITGLTGMKPIHGFVVRPLLFATRFDIEGYAGERSLKHREDETNAETIYLRNKVRHQVIPLMEELNPSFRKGLATTMDHLADTLHIQVQAIASLRMRAVRLKSDQTVEILLDELIGLKPLKTYLFELLRPWGFSGSIAGQMADAIGSQSGKQFYSPEYRATLDRKVLIIEQIRQLDKLFYELEANTSELFEPISLKFNVLDIGEVTTLNTSSSVALLDKDHLIYPLVLRRWEHGDKFMPFGMKGFKKVSDYFIDEKLSLTEKEAGWVLVSGEDIVWIVGRRIDDRYKVTSATKTILRLVLTL